MTELVDEFNSNHDPNQVLNPDDMFKMKDFPSWVNGDPNTANRTKGIQEIIERRRASKTETSQNPTTVNYQHINTEISNSHQIKQGQIPMNRDSAQFSERRLASPTLMEKSKSLENIQLESSLNASDSSFTTPNDEKQKVTMQKRENRSDQPIDITVMSLRESVEGQILSPQADVHKALTPIREIADQSINVKSIQEAPLKSATKLNINSAVPGNSQADQGHGAASGRKNESSRQVKSNRPSDHPSDRRSFLEDEINIGKSNTHGLNLPRFSLDLEDDDELFNQSLSNMPTANREEGMHHNTPKQFDHIEEVKDKEGDKTENHEAAQYMPSRTPSKSHSKKNNDAYEKIEEQDARLNTRENAEEEIITHKNAAPRRKSNINIENQQEGAKASNLLVIEGESPQARKKKKSSRFNSLFFKKQSQNRSGIPTLTGKRRITNDFMNLEKIGIPVDKSDKSKTVAQSAVSDGESTNPTSKSTTSKLMEAFENIQMHRLFKQKMEMFIFFFNQDPEKGINFLIGNELIDNTPEKIARVLLTTEGLNKDMLGQYLGSHKEHRVNVLKAYCHALDFSNLEFDHALRLFLSRFKLPGEAWQIERIVSIFSEAYNKDNPNAFKDPDTPYILSYSLLMLNTDAHSDLIPKHKKMTRQTFINNNFAVCKGAVSAEYLGMMYDNIVKNKFETKTDYIEQIYTRLQLDSNQYLLQGETIKMAMDIANQLMKGATFIKYGRRGKPHERFIYLSKAEDRVCWGKAFKMKESSTKYILVSDIINVYVGASSTKVLKHNKVPPELDTVVFSLETTKRTLDLRAPDLETRSRWEGYFRQGLLHRKQLEEEKAMKLKDYKSKDRERISEIWKTDILPNFHFHWDYEHHQPRGKSELERSVKSPKTDENTLYRAGEPKKRSILKDFFSCKLFKSQSAHEMLQSKLKSSVATVTRNDTENEEDELRALCRNKSLLLYQVWKLGIPDWLRKTIWPITVGNRLEITPTLYHLLLSTADKFKNEKDTYKTVTDYRQAMEKDLPETFWELEYYKEPHNKQALMNVLVAFICYRPDVGYVKGMAHVAAMLVKFCPEYEAFECFVNMTHSYHFISFFRGDMREVEWRIEVFNQYFKKELPQLYNHFSALDISSEMFLLDWFLSLFTTVLTDIDVIGRIWDCFLLEGEVFAIKTAIGLLKYYELELKMIGFASATQFLKKPLQIKNEKHFFELIDSLDISTKEFQKILEKQTVAKINTHIHQALLIS